jgi:glutamine synthetase
MTDTGLPPDIESVSVCVPDHYGRLAGKRVAARRLGAVLADGLDMPDFHLVTGPDIQPAAGVPATGDHTGFPNDLLWPDMPTLRRLPWQPECAIVLAEARRRDGSVIPEAPRAILQRQTERLARRGLSAWVATELEFYVYEDSYAEAFRKGYRDLGGLYHRIGDNDVLVTGFLEPYLGPLRLAMAELGLAAETTQGEGGVGQAEMNFPAGPPVQTADGHVLFKHAAKVIAHQLSRAVTFMAKPHQDQPSSGCHLHLSLRDETGGPCTAAGPGPADTELSERARRFLAGVLAFSPELTLLHAPLVNSYRRLQPGNWAPSVASWGYDNRAAMARVVGRGPSLRMEFRLPGADANPYLTIAAVLAAGIAGLEDGGIELPAALPPGGSPGGGNAGGAAVAMDLTEAIRRFDDSKLARRAFGDAVRDHVSCMARHQLTLARQAVTDWDLEQGFETA